MAKIKLDNLNGDVVKMSSAFDGLRVGLNDTLQGALRPMIQDFTNWMSSDAVKQGLTRLGETIKSWIPTIKEIVTVLASIVMGIWEVADAIIPWEGTIKIVLAIASAVWVVTTAIKAWTASVAIFNAVMALNPVVALMIAIGAAIILVIAYWDEFKIAGNMALDALLLPAKSLYNLIVLIANGLGANMEYADVLSNTEGIMRENEAKANDAARARAAKAQGGKQGGGGDTKVGGSIEVTSKGPATVTTKSSGPVGLRTPNSAGFS